jgi:chemotaxis protein CheD
MAEVNVRMGELATSAEPGTVLMSIGLGSCIGLVLIDPGARIAGLAHIMLPGPGEDAARPPATFACGGGRALLDGVLALGARRMRLTAVIVGGAQMFGSDGKIQVGARNEAAVRAALGEVRVPIVAAQTGGGKGRTIRVYLDDLSVSVREAGGPDIFLPHVAGGSMTRRHNRTVAGVEPDGRATR